jgi:primosomal protein DnaI
MIADEKRRKTSDKIKSHYIPEDVINATFDYIETDPHRATAIMAAMKFCDEFEVGSSKRGLYLYGNFGVGKSLITGAIAQELASQGIDVAMVYVPDFLSEVKDAIDSKTDTVNAKLEALRKVTVLILDDIGAESHSAWTRDEVLGSILQRRMNRLVTIYTSNLTIRELRQHLLNVKKVNPGDQKMHEKKVERIMERIEPFVEVVHVGGRNRRREG